MREYKVISADTHIIEPPDIYSARVSPHMRDRIPRIERRRTVEGKEYDSWFYENIDLGFPLSFTQAGQRFKDASQLDFSSGIWEDIRKAAYDPHEMIKELEMDGVWGGCPQPSQGLLFYRLPDSEVLSAVCHAYNDWVAEFSKPYPDRLKPIACLNTDNVDEACAELVRCARMGFAGGFIANHPLPEKPYRDSSYDRLWWTAQDLEIPLLMHTGTQRYGIPGCENTLNLGDLTAAGVCNFDYWARYSLTAILFAGVFDRYPGLRIGLVEFEMGFVPYWLKQMDFCYVDRPEVFRKGWTSSEGMLPSDYWRRNMFVEFMEDDIGLKHRDMIGVDNILWGNDFPHSEGTWPESMRFLDKIFADFSEEDRRKITSDNAARLFKFKI